ncbi:MAG: hypothetical protein ACYDG3_13105, partial [Bacillati bacterium]
EVRHVTNTKYTINWSATVGAYVLLAVIAAVIAGLTALLQYTEYTPFAITAAIMAAVIAGLMEYSSTGNVPGTPIPLTALAIPIMTALISALEYLLKYQTWSTATIITGIIIFLTVLMQKITPSAPPSASTPAVN